MRVDYKCVVLKSPAKLFVQAIYLLVFVLLLDIFRSIRFKTIVSAIVIIILDVLAIYSQSNGLTSPAPSFLGSPGIPIWLTIVVSGLVRGSKQWYWQGCRFMLSIGGDDLQFYHNFASF